MGTQQQTNSNQTSQNQLQFNPGAENLYNMLTGAGGSVLSQYMNNPLGNQYYKLGQSESQRGASQLGAQAMGVLGQNQKVSGLTGNDGAGWLGAQTAKTGRSNMSMMSQANLQNIMAAFNRQMGATGQAMSFSPQITGSTGSGTSNSTTSTSGLGTWLPQLLGAGLGMGMGAMTGGLSGMAGAAMGGGGASGGSIGGSFGGNLGPGVLAGAPSGGFGFGSVPGNSGFAPPNLAALGMLQPTQ